MIGRIAHWASIHGVSRVTNGSMRCFSRASRGTSMWRDTPQDTTSVTAGTRPAAAAIVKLTEPWQWTTALSADAPVRSRIVATDAGWS